MGDMAKAKIGQMVLVRDDTADLGECAAVVTRVWSDDESNVTAYPDQAHPVWVASVPWGKPDDAAARCAWPLPR